MRKSVLVGLILFSTAFTGFGCANGRDGSPIKNPNKSTVSPNPSTETNLPTNSPTNSQLNSQASPFVLTSSYLGKNLTLIYPHSQNFGFISVSVDDARALFYSLAIKSQVEPGNLNYLASDVRRGYDMICYRETLRSAPEDHRFSCSIYIDYRAGKVSTQVSTVLQDETASTLSSDYTGKNVFIQHADSHTAFILLEGDDARALYFTMDGVTSTGPHDNILAQTTKKRGGDFLCTESVHQDVTAQNQYDCRLELNALDGRVH